jgi:hypothetical protein
MSESIDYWTPIEDDIDKTYWVLCRFKFVLHFLELSSMNSKLSIEIVSEFCRKHSKNNI